MSTPKNYRLAYVGMAIELLRPLATDYVVTSEFQTENFAFLEWSDPRPQPEVEEVLRIVEALRAVEDSVETVYTEEQLSLVPQPVEEAPEQEGLSGSGSGLA